MEYYLNENGDITSVSLEGRKTIVPLNKVGHAFRKLELKIEELQKKYSDALDVNSYLAEKVYEYSLEDKNELKSKLKEKHKSIEDLTTRLKETQQHNRKLRQQLETTFQELIKLKNNG